MSKTGILGGTFNPIHYGHLELAEAAYRECGLDKVMIMPSGVSYLKKDQYIPSGEDRLNMCRAAVCSLKDPDLFPVSDFEVKREGNTYTYETLTSLKKLYPYDELYFIIGADSLFYIDSWKEPEIIFSSCTLVCSGRGGSYSLDEMKKRAGELSERFSAKIFLLEHIPRDISSTEIRKLIGEGAPKSVICDYIPEAEYDYMIRNNVYSF